MRAIHNIVLHCTATPQTTTPESITRHWREVNGWKSPGYHHLIKANGEDVNLQPIELPSNGVAGHNANSIHISYIGGMTKDDRTFAQKETMLKLVKKYKAMFPEAKVLGHRDFVGVKKACPNFSVKDWLKTVGL